jgi:hypothetical protein
MEGSIAERLRAFIKAFDVQCTECRCDRVGHIYLHNFVCDAGPVARELAPVTAWQPTPIHLPPHDLNVGAGLPAKAASQPTAIYLTPRGPTVGAGLPAKAASQPTAIYLTPRGPTVGAGLPAKAAWQSTQLDCVHIHSCGNGHLGFRPDGGSLLKSAKVSKTLLPHHSAPRLGSVCP